MVPLNGADKSIKSPANTNAMHKEIQVNFEANQSRLFKTNTLELITSARCQSCTRAASSCWRRATRCSWGGAKRKLKSLEERRRRPGGRRFWCRGNRRSWRGHSVLVPYTDFEVVISWKPIHVSGPLGWGRSWSKDSHFWSSHFDPFYGQKLSKKCHKWHS